MIDYFALLGFPRAYALDEKAVHQAYLAAQRAAHPDKQTDEARRMAALQASADLNEVYRVLRDPLKRAEHLLALEGLRVGSQGDEVKPSSVLLMESMDMRERLSDASGVAEIDALDQEARAARNEAIAAFLRHYEAREFPQAAQALIRWRFLVKFFKEINAVRGALLQNGKAESGF
jgi:molecular chaperone HscB